MQIPFGKHRGTEISDIPRDYLQWLWNTYRKPGQLLNEVAAALGLTPPTITENPVLALCDYDSHNANMLTGMMGHVYNELRKGKSVDAVYATFVAKLEGRYKRPTSKYRVLNTPEIREYVYNLIHDFVPVPNSRRVYKESLTL